MKGTEENRSGTMSDKPIPDLRPTSIDVDLSAFAHNLEVAKKLAGRGAAVMAVLKANGYGHGSVPLAGVATSLGCPLIGVATVEEGHQLRKAGIQTETVVLGGIPPGAEAFALEEGLSTVLFDLSSAERLDREASARGKSFSVHLKIDTGMGRLGFLPGDMEKAIRRIKDLRSLEITGIMTHYARADESDAAPTLKQAALFESALKAVEQAGIEPKWVHCQNSAALLLGRGPRYNLARPGIMLYGALPPGFDGPAEEYGLKSVLTFKTSIIQLREVPDGWPISYGGNFVASGRRRIAVIPAGYADGLLRYNTGGEVLVGEKRVPIAGTVCMDMTMIDVTGVKDVAIGDEVIMIGRRGADSISAEEVARRGRTISYEVFCGLSARINRHYHHGRNL